MFVFLSMILLAPFFSKASDVSFAGRSLVIGQSASERYDRFYDLVWRQSLSKHPDMGIEERRSLVTSEVQKMLVATLEQLSTLPEELKSIAEDVALSADLYYSLMGLQIENIFEIKSAINRFTKNVFVANSSEEVQKLRLKLIQELNDFIRSPKKDEELPPDIAEFIESLEKKVAPPQYIDESSELDQAPIAPQTPPPAHNTELLKEF